MSSFGETNVNNYNLDSMDYAHDSGTNIVAFTYFTPFPRLKLMAYGPLTTL